MKLHKYNETTKEQISAYNLVHNCWTGRKFLNPETFKDTISKGVNVELVLTLATNYINENERPVILTLYSHINRYFPLPARRIKTTCGEFIIEGKIATSATDNDFYYELERENLTDTETAEFLEDIFNNE